MTMRRRTVLQGALAGRYWPAHRLLAATKRWRPRRTQGLPWGVQLGAGWEQASWGDGYGQETQTRADDVYSAATRDRFAPA